MTLKVTKTDDWLVYQPQSLEILSQDFDKILACQASDILREHHRSLVIKVAFKGRDYVIKTPHNKNRSLWIRLTTLYRDSEVVRDLKSQVKLASLAIDSVEPVVALEKRKLGMVVDSRIIYIFKPGSEISKAEYPQMIQIMNKLHDNGFLHDDPHPKNFLKSSHGVFVIDCKPRLNKFGGPGIAHNNIVLARRSPDRQYIYELIGKSPENDRLYRFVNRIINLQQIQRSVKNTIRKSFGIKHKKPAIKP